MSPSSVERQRPLAFRVTRDDPRSTEAWSHLVGPDVPDPAMSRPLRASPPSRPTVSTSIACLNAGHRQVPPKAGTACLGRPEPSGAFHVARLSDRRARRSRGLDRGWQTRREPIPPPIRTTTRRRLEVLGNDERLKCCRPGSGMNTNQFPPPEEIIDEAECARRLLVRRETLHRWRRDAGLPYVPLSEGRRARVRYIWPDVVAWLRSRAEGPAATNVPKRGRPRNVGRSRRGEGGPA